MVAALQILGHQFKEIWRHFGPGQRFQAILLVLILAGVIGGTLYWGTRPSYRLLFSGLSMEDAATAVEKLEEARIPVQLRDSGRAVYVPAQHVYRSRLRLAAEGIPKQTNTGFELFETPKFGLTDFAQRINYQRALQGELERTIVAMDGIQAARVMLVLPTERVFQSPAERQASASVMITVSDDRALSAAHVKSIRHLVAGSVPGLGVSGITVTDQLGRLLSQGSESDPSEGMASTEQLETRERLEGQLGRKAQDMLDLALGPGRSIVKVSALLDFSRIEKRNETYQAEGRVVSSEKIQTESSTPGAPAAGGAAGMMANVPVGNPDRMVMEKGGGGQNRKENIMTEYRIPSGVEHLVDNGVRVKQLSVSVCVASSTTPRTPEELKQIENMIRSAVGIAPDSSRSDTIQVVELEFPASPVPEAPAWHQRLPVSLSNLGQGTLAVLVLLVVLGMTRRTLTGLSVQGETVGMPVHTLHGMQPESAGGPALVEAGAGNQIDQLGHLAEQNPRAVAAWISNVAKTHR